MSGNAENEYFSDGLTETLLHMLAQIPELKVAARTSSFAFKDKQEDVRNIAEALHVAHILEGSVQRSGDRVRITAQLIRAEDGYHIWSENYDRTLNDIFAIQDEIAGKVGGALAESLLGAGEEISIVGIGTDNIAAYELYLEARQFSEIESFSALSRAETLLKDALSRDPEFLDAKTELAVVFWSQQNTGMRPAKEALDQTIALAGQVVAVRPRDARARTILALANARKELNSGRNIKAFYQLGEKYQQIVNDSPSEIEPRVSLAFNLSIFGKPEESAAHFEKALELDALNPWVYRMQGNALLNSDQFELAIAAFERSLELNADQPNSIADIGDAKAGLGDYAALVEAYLSAGDVDSQDHELPAVMAVALYKLGMIESADQLLNRARSIAPTSSTVQMAELWRAYSYGNDDEAFSLARSMIDADTSGRHFAFQDAVSIYASIAMNRNEARAAYEFLGERFPNIHAGGSIEVQGKVYSAQLRLFDLWMAARPREEALAAIQGLLDINESVNWGPEEQPLTFIAAYAARGDTEAAIELGLQKAFLQPASNFRDWRFYFDRPVLADVAADPRVVAELERLEFEEEVARADITTYLASRD